MVAAALALARSRGDGRRRRRRHTAHGRNRLLGHGPTGPGRGGHGLDGDGGRQRPPSRVRCVVKAVLGSRWFRGAISLAVVVVIFAFFFPMVADYGAVWDTIAAMTPIELAILALVAAWNIVSYWPMLTAVQPGLRAREADVANLASTAVANTLPGGGALGVGITMTMQRSWGIPVASTALATVVSGIWNNFVKLGLPV